MQSDKNTTKKALAVEHTVTAAFSFNLPLTVPLRPEYKNSVVHGGTMTANKLLDCGLKR